MNPSEHWTQLVNKIMAQTRCGHSEAWRITASAHPDAATLMSAYGRSRNTVQFFNSREAGKSTPEKAKATKEFYEFVNEKEKSGQSPVAAYQSAAREHTDLIAEMLGSLNALITTIPLKGIQQNTTSKFIQTDVISPNDLSFWQRRRPEMDPTHNVKFATDYAGLAIIQGSGSRDLDPNVYPNMIIAGGWAPWMADFPRQFASRCGA